LNSIADGDAYSVTIDFSGSVTSLGTHALLSAILGFSDPAAPASEMSFGSFLCNGTSTIACLTVTADGSFDDISLLGCLTTGAFGCAENQLDANFKIPAASLNSLNVTAQTIVPIAPLDLLEDDGVTDIQGSVTKYSYTGASPIPEPSALFLLMALCAWIALRPRRTRMPFWNPSKNGEQL
jgi:hypothetical protein